MEVVVAAAALPPPSAVGSTAGRPVKGTRQHDEDIGWNRVQLSQKTKEEASQFDPRDELLEDGWSVKVDHILAGGKGQRGKDDDVGNALQRVIGSACSCHFSREGYRHLSAGTRLERLFAESAALLASVGRHSRHVPEYSTARRKFGRRRNEANGFEFDLTTHRQTRMGNIRARAACGCETMVATPRWRGGS